MSHTKIICDCNPILTLGSGFIREVTRSGLIRSMPCQADQNAHKNSSCVTLYGACGCDHRGLRVLTCYGKPEMK